MVRSNIEKKKTDSSQTVPDARRAGRLYRDSDLSHADILLSYIEMIQFSLLVMKSSPAVHPWLD
jgi:hypothetical protein